MKILRVFIEKSYLGWIVWIIAICGGGYSFMKLDWSIEGVKYVREININAHTKYISTLDILYKYTSDIQNKLKSVAGIKTISSKTEKDDINITLEIKDDVNMENVVLSIKDIIFNTNRPSVLNLPRISQGARRKSPIITLYIKGSKHTLREITSILKKELKQDIERIDGVSRVEVEGQSPPEIMITLNAAKAYYYGITINDISRMIKMHTKEDPLASRSEGGNSLSFSMPASLIHFEDIKNIVLNQNNVRIKDVANISISMPDLNLIVWRNSNQQCVQIDIYSSANPVNVSKEVKKLLPDIIDKYSLDIEIEDKSENLDVLLRKIWKTFLEAIILIVLIILIFLGSFKSAITPILAIPISLIVTFIPMKLFNCTLNTITLSAFLIAIGLVVDDAIVIVENIVKKYNVTKNLKKAAIQGTEEIFWPVVVMTLTLSFVFLPVLIAKGGFADLLREFAIVLCSSVIISGLLSITLSPMLSAKYLGHSDFIEKILNKVEQFYKDILYYIIRIRWFVLSLAACLVGSSLFLLTKIQKENYPFVPSYNFIINSRSIPRQNKNISYFIQRANIIEQYLMQLKKNKIINNYIIQIKSNYITMNIKTNNSTAKEQVLKKLELICKDLYFNAIDFDDKDRVDIILYENTSIEELKRVINDFRDIIENSPIIKSTIGYGISSNEYTLEIDYNKAFILQISPDLIQEIINSIMSKTDIGALNVNREKYRIIIGTDKKESVIKMLELPFYFRNRIIQPSLFIKIKERKKQNSIFNYMGYQAQEVSIYYDPNKHKLGDVINEIQTKHQQYFKKKLRIAFTDLAKEYMENQNQMFYLFLLSLILIMFILIAQTDSIKNTLIIVLTVPLSLVGSIGAIFACTTINIYTAIGIITLVGLITKHGVLFINSASAYRSQGYSKKESAINGAADRLRPILITTLAMALGVLPLLFETHSIMIGLKDMSIVIFYGISIGTLLVLFVVPCMYSLFGEI